MLIIRPRRRLIIARRIDWVKLNAPRKFVLITVSQSSIDIRMASPSRVTPALFTRMSILVKSLRICSPAFWTAA